MKATFLPLNNFLFSGAAYPLVLTVPLNGALAVMYRTIEVPFFTKKATPAQFFQFWVSKLRYFKVQFVTLSIFQTLVGMYLAGKQYQTVQLLNELDTKNQESHISSPKEL